MSVAVVASHNVWATKAEDWEAHKEIISQLYWDQDKTLKEVMEVMRQDHGFNATYASCTTIPTRASF
jgi:hypothetical protein